MVPILSSSEKLNAGWISILALFGSRLLSSANSRATNFTLEGQESVFPKVAKMTLIVPRGGLEEVSLLGFRTCLTPLATRMMQKLLQLSFSDQLVQMVPQISTVLRSVSLVLMVFAIKALRLMGFPVILFWPFEERLILNLLQNLMHRFSEHHINCLSISKPWLPSKVSLRPLLLLYQSDLKSLFS